MKDSNADEESRQEPESPLITATLRLEVDFEAETESSLLLQIGLVFDWLRRGGYTFSSPEQGIAVKVNGEERIISPDKHWKDTHESARTG